MIEVEPQSIINFQVNLESLFPLEGWIIHLKVYYVLTDNSRVADTLMRSSLPRVII